MKKINGFSRIRILHLTSVILLISNFHLDRIVILPYSFEGYRIDIDAVGVMEITRLDLYVTQNSPNPFRGSTEIVYQTKETGNILFDVYDLLGKKVYNYL